MILLQHHRVRLTSGIDDVDFNVSNPLGIEMIKRWNDFTTRMKQHPTSKFRRELFDIIPNYTRFIGR
jgi:hypothetical protein